MPDMVSLASSSEPVDARDSVRGPAVVWSDFSGHSMQWLFGGVPGVWKHRL